MMKILIVGGDYTWSIERFYLKHLNSIKEVKAYLFPAQNHLYAYLDAHIVHKIQHRLGLSGIYKSINRELFQKLEEHKPDILWVFKGMEVLPETLSYAKGKGIRIANYNPDNPFIFTGRGSGNTNVSRTIRLYDLHFSYSQEIMAQLNAFSSSYQVHFLPFGYELPEDLQLDPQPKNEIISTCFIGNPDKERAAFLKQLLDLGIEVDLYGNGWNRYLKHANAKAFAPVYHHDLYKYLQLYRVQLNMLRKHNVASHNMRTFEIPAVGGIQLAPYTKEHVKFFRNGEEIFLYHDAKGAASLTQQLLLKDKEEVVLLRSRARERCERDAYSYRDRSRYVHKIFSLL
jgi:spore maturation protein CgeB